MMMTIIYYIINYKYILHYKRDLASLLNSSSLKGVCYVGRIKNKNQGPTD